MLKIMAKGGFNRAMEVPTLLLMMIIIIMVAMIVAANAAIPCSTVASTLLPCVPFAAGSAAQPSQACCNGVRSLNSAAKTTPDRQAVCNCIKTLDRSFAVNYAKASKLPGLCGVNVGFPISPSTNCAAIH